MQVSEYVSEYVKEIIRAWNDIVLWPPLCFATDVSFFQSFSTSKVAWPIVAELCRMFCDDPTDFINVGPKLGGPFPLPSTFWRQSDNFTT